MTIIMIFCFTQRSKEVRFFYRKLLFETVACVCKKAFKKRRKAFAGGHWKPVMGLSVWEKNIGGWLETIRKGFMVNNRSGVETPLLF